MKSDFWAQLLDLIAGSVLGSFLVFAAIVGGLLAIGYIYKVYDRFFPPRRR